MDTQRAWFGWYTEYPDEGSVLFEADSEGEALRETMARLGAESEEEVSVQRHPDTLAREVARLREELSRAAARDVVAEDLIRRLLEHGRGRVGYGALRRRSEDFFADPSLLADAAQELLVAAVERRLADLRVSETAICSDRTAQWSEVDIIEAVEDYGQACSDRVAAKKREEVAVDRYRALLEGRGEG